MQMPTRDKRIVGHNWKVLMSIFEEEFPEVRFCYKHDPPGWFEDGTSWMVRLVGLIFGLLGYFSVSLKEWYFYNSTSYLGNWIVLSPKHDLETKDYATFKVLLHELRHCFQKRDKPLWSMRYLVAPFPVIWTFRSGEEFEAYSDSIWCDFHIIGRDPEVKYYAKMFVDYRYGWMGGFTDKAYNDWVIKFIVVTEQIKTKKHVLPSEHYKKFLAL
jgi:hypothetical protein